MKISINNSQNLIKIRITPFRKIVKEILKTLNIKQKTVHILLTDNTKISLLNKRYLGRNYPTDVISFFLEDSFDPRGVLGEIVISVEKAIENSKRFKNLLQDEIILYLIHGILHLKGFKDRTREEKKKMRLEEKKIAKILKRKLKKVSFLIS